MRPNYGDRLKYLHTKHGMTQDELAERLGFESRQIVSNIEKGTRKVGAEEIVQASEIFNVEMSFFTNPYLLVGRGEFSWRQTVQNMEALTSFEEKAGEWIGAYRVLKDQLGDAPHLIMPEIRLASNARLDAAVEAGEAVAEQLKLGEMPGKDLIEVTEESLGSIVLHVEPQDGISGAACRLQNLNAVIINRCEPVGRRTFNLAHEIFHLLTWEAMPPKKVDVDDPRNNRGKSHTEKLADAFASGMLLPSKTIRKYAEYIDYGKSGCIERINSLATEMNVSAVALGYRMIKLGLVDKATFEEYRSAGFFSYNGDMVDRNDTPPLYSKKFLTVLSRGIRNGLVSQLRVLKLLDLSLEETKELYEQHKLESPFGI